MLTTHVCFYCVSYAHLLAPNFRYQLGSQTDIFNYFSFVVRGCMEQISTTKLRIDRKFQKKGCYIVRSKRFYPTLALLSYIICVCFIEYCNCDMQKSFLHKNQSESDSISLVSTVEDERLARAEIHGLATALNSFITCTCCESAFCECSTQ
uniref:Uncharacterized protein n=1 Tax=Wuchereria bancrofti TaxID=6293 RepID=A0AAF5PUG0_WUCBA